MDTLAHSDIFFFILSVSIVVLTGVLVIGIYSLLSVIREARQLIRSVRAEFESFRSKRRELELRGRTVLKMLRVLRAVTFSALRRK